MIEQVNQQNQKNADLYNTAIQDKNPLLCDGITTTEKQSECRDMIRAVDIRKSGTIESCDTLGTVTLILCRDAITSDTAITKNDSTLCESISSSERQTYCRETIDEVSLRSRIEAHTVTRDFCDTLVAKYQTSCMTEIRERDESDIYTRAIATDDTTLCQTITQVELKTTCIDTILMKRASQTGNPALCESISDIEKRVYCETQVSKVSDVTLYKKAIAGTDIAACTQVSNTNLQNKCHDTITINLIRSTGNSTLCDTLRNTTLIASCRQIGK